MNTWQGLSPRPWKGPGPPAHSSLVHLLQTQQGGHAYMESSTPGGLGHPRVCGPCCLFGVSCPRSPSSPPQMLAGGPMPSDGS